MPHTVLTAAPQASYDTLILIVAVLVVGWLVSLWLHPFTPCWDCKGTPKKWGSIYTRSFDLCRTCEGRGRRMRMGARMFPRNQGIK